MNLTQSLAGMLRLRITSPEAGRTLTVLMEAGIPVHRVIIQDLLTLRLTVSRGDYRKIRRICEKRGWEVHILRRLGLWWRLTALAQRPVLMAGLGILFALTLFLPTRVLFLRVEGNHRIPAGQILEAAEDCGIRFGASRREVRSEKMKNALLHKIPQLQWAGINTAGCTALISVREGEPEPEGQAPEGLRAIVAARDGVVTERTVTGGSGLCMVGEAVKAGQTLISPYTDCGIAIRVSRAQGEIIAQTRRDLRAVTPSECLFRREEGEYKRRVSLILGKKRINFWKDSGISHGTCDRMYAEYYITLPGGFRLPVRIAVETVTAWQTETDTVDPARMEDALREFSREYVLDQMVSGEILGTQGALRHKAGLVILDSTFRCRESIGREMEIQIGEYNG